MRIFRRIEGLAILLFLQSMVAVPALSITDEEIFRDLRFNFINPGGRSLGMGGAFISLADDATAAQANPAGLTTLLSPQLFLEMRYADLDVIATTREFRDPIAPGNGFDVLVETDSDRTLSPSFLSYVYPWDRLSFGISHQEVINTDNRTESTYEFLFDDQSDIRTGAGQIDIELINWSFSVAYTVHERFRVGGTISYGMLDLRSEVVNSYVDPSGDLIGNPGLAGVPFEMYRTTVDDSDTDVTFTGGFLWMVSDKVSLGGSYRQGGDFEVRETLIANPIDPALVPGSITSQVFFNETDTLLTPGNDTFSFANEFHVPDVIGAGVSWRPQSNLTLALDAVSIHYGDLMEGFNSRLNVLTVGFESEEEARFALEDQTNLHLGAEYLLQSAGGNTRVILRAGFHQDKDNRLRSDFAPGGFGLGSNENFPGRDDENHFSAGVGIVVGNHLQLDTAVDVSDPGTEGVISLIYKF